ncbi:MAG: hypothetical protein WC500_01355 [Candidatus Margulisiibacteriota bacterium]
MFSLKLSTREKNLLIAALIILLVYLFDSFFFRPIMKEVNLSKDTARNLRLELRVAEGKIRILETLQKKIGILHDESATSRQARALEALGNISLATTKSKLNLITVRPIVESTKGSLKFGLACTGKYKNLYDFMVFLNELPMLVIIDNLDCTSDGTKDPALDIKMTLTAYY